MSRFKRKIISAAFVSQVLISPMAMSADIDAPVSLDSDYITSVISEASGNSNYEPGNIIPENSSQLPLKEALSKNEESRTHRIYPALEVSPEDVEKQRLIDLSATSIAPAEAFDETSVSDKPNVMRRVLKMTTSAPVDAGWGGVCTAITMAPSSGLDGVGALLDVLPTNGTLHCFSTLVTERTKLRAMMQSIPQGANYNLHLFENNGTSSPDYIGSSSNTSNQNESFEVMAENNYYYIIAEAVSGATSAETYTVAFAKFDSFDGHEMNDSSLNATSLNEDAKVKGNLDSWDDLDWFSYVPGSDEYSFDIKFQGQPFHELLILANGGAQILGHGNHVISTQPGTQINFLVRRKSSLASDADLDYSLDLYQRGPVSRMDSLTLTSLYPDDEYRQQFIPGYIPGVGNHLSGGVYALQIWARLYRSNGDPARFEKFYFDYTSSPTGETQHQYEEHEGTTDEEGRVHVILPLPECSIPIGSPTHTYDAPGSQLDKFFYYKYESFHISVKTSTGFKHVLNGTNPIMSHFFNLCSVRAGETLYQSIPVNRFPDYSGLLL